MKIGVLIKQTPDTESKIKPKADGSGIETDGIKYIISPYDEFAIEEAIQTKEAVGDAETTVVSIGPERVTEALRTALAMGIDKAVRIDDEGIELDSLLTAKVLANAIKDQNFDVIFTGRQAIDGDCGQVSQMLAELLDVAHVTVVEGFELNDDKQGARVSRRAGGGANEIIDLKFPALVACEKGLNTPRYASLPGIMKAKKKPLEVLKVSDFSQGAQAKVKFANYRLPEEKHAGKILQGDDPQAMVSELVKLLHEEAKVI
jgi:electron transfer flavoprotein beta subunit